MKDKIITIFVNAALGAVASVITVLLSGGDASAGGVVAAGAATSATLGDFAKGVVSSVFM